MVIYLLIWCLIIIFGIKKSDKNEKIFSKENTLALRGISAFEIMLGHIGLATGSIFLFPNRKAGILFVAVFFFLSGYGLMYSKKKKKDYLCNGFILKKVCKIIIPAYIVYVLFIIFINCFTNTSMELKAIFDFENFFMQTNWFVWEIIVLYILFYLFYRKKNKYADLYFFLTILLSVTICYYVHLDNPWFGSTLAFWFGIYYYENNEKINVFLLSKYWVKFFCFSTILCISIMVFFMRPESFFGSVIARNIASVDFIVLIILFGFKFKIGNRISYWLGRYSYEIYLFHIMFVTVFQEIVEMSPFLYGGIVILCTMICSIVYNKIEYIITKLFIKRK